MNDGDVWGSVRQAFEGFSGAISQKNFPAAQVYMTQNGARSDGQSVGRIAHQLIQKGFTLTCASGPFVFDGRAVLQMVIVQPKQTQGVWLCWTFEEEAWRAEAWVSTSQQAMAFLTGLITALFHFESLPESPPGMDWAKKRAFEVLASFEDEAHLDVFLGLAHRCVLSRVAPTSPAALVERWASDLDCLALGTFIGSFEWDRPVCLFSNGHDGDRERSALLMATSAAQSGLSVLLVDGPDGSLAQRLSLSRLDRAQMTEWGFSVLTHDTSLVDGERQVAMGEWGDAYDCVLIHGTSLEQGVVWVRSGAQGLWVDSTASGLDALVAVMAQIKSHAEWACLRWHASRFSSGSKRTEVEGAWLFGPTNRSIVGLRFYDLSSDGSDWLDSDEQWAIFDGYRLLSVGCLPRPDQLFEPLSADFVPYASPDEQETLAHFQAVGRFFDAFSDKGSLDEGAEGRQLLDALLYGDSGSLTEWAQLSDDFDRWQQMQDPDRQDELNQLKEQLKGVFSRLSTEA